MSTNVMKIKIKKEVEEELEITFPVYRDHGYYFYKITSENEFIAVSKPMYGKTGIQIATNGQTTIQVVLSDKTPEFISCQDFQEAYFNALSHLKSIAFEPQDTNPLKLAV